jgi:hypothetical protein
MKREQLQDLIASGRACPCIPHLPQLMEIVCREWKWNDTMSSAEKRTDLVRSLVKEVKAGEYKKATLKAYEVYLNDAHKYYTQVKTVRAQRNGTHQFEEKALSLEERLVERFYIPHMMTSRSAAIGGDKNTVVRIKRGEPKVRVFTDYIKRVHGIRPEHHYTHSPTAVEITFSKGWSYLARAGKAVVYAGPDQYLQLIVGYESKQPDMFQFDWQADWELAEVQLLCRRQGSAKELAKPRMMGRCGDVVVFGDEPTHIYKKLPAAVVKAVIRKLEA